MLSGMTVLCFAACYVITLGLEVTRLLFRVSLRMVAILAFASAGLLAHTLYLFAQAREGFVAGAPLSSWYHWCLMGAWVLAATYLTLAVRRPQTAMGLFMLPMILVAVAVAHFGYDTLAKPFPTLQARSYWATLHGASLLLGTASVFAGFVAGVMHLAQSYRLKRKLPPRPGFRLPSLEWLQRAGERSVVVSAVLLAGGLLSGIVLNAIRHVAGGPTLLPWTDPAVWTSGILFLWLVAVLVFNGLYRPARQGNKVAYLTVANFAFLCLVLAIVLFGPSRHAVIDPQGPPPKAAAFGGPSKNRVPLLRRSSVFVGKNGLHCFCEAVAHGFRKAGYFRRAAGGPSKNGPGRPWGGA